MSSELLNLVERLIVSGATISVVGGEPVTEPYYDPCTSSTEGLDDCCFFCGVETAFRGRAEVGMAEGMMPHHPDCAWIEAMDRLGHEHPEHVVSEHPIILRQRW